MRHPKKIINNKNETQAISEISAITIVKKEIEINRSEKIQQNNSTHSSFLNNKQVSN